MLSFMLWIVALAAAQVAPQAPSAAAPFGQGESREAGHRSHIRIRDPFVLPDRDEQVYYIYGSTNRGLSPTDARKEVVRSCEAFIRMYRPHEAREDTVLFPAFRDLVSKDEYERLGEAFESQETKVLGEKGYERIVGEVAQIERTLGIYELASFTPRL